MLKMTSEIEGEIAALNTAACLARQNGRFDLYGSALSELVPLVSELSRRKDANKEQVKLYQNALKRA